jgi:hypothetical protein
MPKISTADGLASNEYTLTPVTTEPVEAGTFAHGTVGAAWFQPDVPVFARPGGQ